MLLTPLTDFNPVPRVNVTVEEADVAAGADHVTVWRTVDGRSEPVRGMVNRAWTGSDLTLLDVEAAFAAATYRVESLHGGVSAGFAPGGQVTVAPSWGGRESPALIQCPFDPALSVQVSMLAGTATEITREVRGTLDLPLTGDRPVWVGGGPLMGRNTPFLLLTDTAGADMLQRITEAYPVWLVRTPPPIRLPRIYYALAPRLVEVDVDVHRGGDRVSFSLEFTEVAPPAIGLVRSLLTYDDLDASYPDYDTRDAAYASYSEMDSDWSLAGAAGEV